MSTTWNRSLRGLALSLCFVMVLAPVVRAEAMTPNSGTLRATVGVGTTHAPVTMVTIRVVDMETAEEVAVATTDEAGTVTLPELAEGTYHVSAVAPAGFVASAAPIISVAAGETPEVAISLMPAQDGQEGQETECADGDDECVAAAAAAAAAAGGSSTPLILALLGAAGIAAGIIGVTSQDDGPGENDVVTQ